MARHMHVDRKSMLDKVRSNYRSQHTIGYRREDSETKSECDVEEALVAQASRCSNARTCEGEVEVKHEIFGGSHKTRR